MHQASKLHALLQGATVTSRYADDVATGQRGCARVNLGLHVQREAARLTLILGLEVIDQDVL